jgi:hypothetical protein
LVLLAALRWRRPEARLLVTLACVPQTPLLYEAVPLFLIPARWSESWLLAALTVAVEIALEVSGPYASYDARMATGGKWMVWLLYVPCAGIVLCRPNVRHDQT